LLLSASSIGSYRSCPFKYFARYECQRVPVEESEESLPLKFGLAFHKGREIWRLTRDVNEALAQAEATFGQASILEDLYTVARLRDLLSIYFEYYADDVRRFTPILPELPFHLKLSDGVDFHGRVDEVVKENATGRIFFVDTKTTQRPGSFLAYPNTQMTGYAWAGHQIYGPEIFGGIIVDIVGVYKTKPQRAKSGPNPWKQGAAPHDVFFRYIVEFTPEQTREWADETMDTARSILARRESNIWPRWSACMSYQRECGYLSVCKAPPQERMNLLYSDAFTLKPTQD